MYPYRCATCKHCLEPIEKATMLHDWQHTRRLQPIYCFGTTQQAEPTPEGTFCPIEEKPYE